MISNNFSLHTVCFNSDCMKAIIIKHGFLSDLHEIHVVECSSKAYNFIRKANFNYLIEICIEL